jgi:hypothetical protein
VPLPPAQLVFAVQHGRLRLRNEQVKPVSLLVRRLDADGQAVFEREVLRMLRANGRVHTRDNVTETVLHGLPGAASQTGQRKNPLAFVWFWWEQFISLIITMDVEKLGIEHRRRSVAKGNQHLARAGMPVRTSA